MPIQKLPLQRKGDKWKESNIEYWIGKANVSLQDEEKMKTSYDLYNSKFDQDDIKYVTDPFQVDEGFPASPQNFNIIKPKIDLLIGEESKRPDTIKVIQSSREGASNAESSMKKLLFNNIVSRLRTSLTGQRPEDGSTRNMTLEQIQDYIDNDFTDIAERSGYYALKYLKNKLNISNELLKGFKDALIADREFYYTGILNGEPVLERVNPIGFYPDLGPDVENIEDGDYAVRHMKMSPAAIYDRFYDLLKEKNYLDKLLELAGGDPISNKPSDVNYNKVVYKENLEHNVKNTDDSSIEYIDVYHVVWKSFKKIGFLTYIDEKGLEMEETVDETYKMDEDDKARGAEIEWQWVTEVWEGYRIGDDIYVGVEPIPNQEFAFDNPNANKLPYIGSVYNNDNSSSTSLVDLMKPLQYMYIIIWYRLELTLARDKGRIFTMDVTQIPKSQGIDVQKWLHYLTSMGVNFVNPYEEGWDIPGREGGNPATFNQMSAQDLTMSNVIAEYIQLIQKIEDMIGELSGISKQRQGSISQHELVGNVERSVVQSSHVTEPLFWKHNQIKKRVYQALIETSKVAWADSDDKTLHFAMDDMTRSFINITDEFTYADLDVYVSDSSDENRKIQMLHQLSEAAISQGSSLYEVSEALASNNVVEIKNKLKKLEDKREKLQQQQQKAEQQSKLQEKQMEMEETQAELDFKREDSIRQSETDIQVALINAESKDSSLKDELDLRQFELKRMEARQKSEKINEEKRQNRVQEGLKQKELALKSRQMNNKNTTSK